jgi:hypothetical protein
VEIKRDKEEKRKRVTASCAQKTCFVGCGAKKRENSNAHSAARLTSRARRRSAFAVVELGPPRSARARTPRETKPKNAKQKSIFFRFFFSFSFVGWAAACRVWCAVGVVAVAMCGAKRKGCAGDARLVNSLFSANSNRRGKR